MKYLKCVSQLRAEPYIPSMIQQPSAMPQHHMLTRGARFEYIIFPDHWFLFDELFLGKDFRGYIN